MALFSSPFNARAVQPATVGGGQNLPPGEYPCVITASEIVPTKAGDGGILVLDLEAVDGEHKGTKGKWRLNLFNPNAQATQIAQRQLSSLCHVTGVYDVTDSTQLHGKPFVAVVELDLKNQEAYPGSTRVVGVLDMQMRDPGKSGGPANPATPHPAATPPTPHPAATPPAAQPFAAAPAVQSGPPAAAAPAGWGAPAAQPAGNGAAPAGAWQPPGAAVAAPAAGAQPPWVQR